MKKMNIIKKIKSKLIVSCQPVVKGTLDNHASIIEGSINAIERRIVVSNNDIKRSQNLLQALTNHEENK